MLNCSYIYVLPNLFVDNKHFEFFHYYILYYVCYICTIYNYIHICVYNYILCIYNIHNIIYNNERIQNVYYLQRGLAIHIYNYN